MIINTTAGKTYAVTPAADCTVSTPEGILIATCPAGGQTYFIAPCAEVEVSDDAALVTESFKGAPAGSSAAGGNPAFQSVTVEGNLTAKGALKLGHGASIKGVTDREIGIDILSVYTNATVNNLYILDKGGFSGPATFSKGVTMAQTLNVAGTGTFRGIEVLGNGNDQISIYSDAGGAALIKPTALLYMGPEYVQNQEECDARYGRIEASNTWSGDQTINGNFTITGIADLGNVRTLNASLQKTDVHGPASFDYGVTMAQSLNVAGVATVFRCAIYEEAYSLFAVLTGSAVWQNRASGVFELRGDDSYSTGVSLSIGRSNGESAQIIKQNQKAPLDPTDVPNCGEGDTRWVKFNNTLTDAEYAALAVKEKTTLYITSDTGKIYLGSYSLN